MSRLLTPAEAKLWLQARGITVQAFAATHNLDAATCYQVLDGRKKGLRGKAHAAAVALGIKEDVPEYEYETVPRPFAQRLSKPD